MWGKCQGGCEPRIELIVKMKKSREGGPVGVGGWGQGGGEQRTEVIEKMQKKTTRCGGPLGGGGKVRQGGGERIIEVIVEMQKQSRRGGGGGGQGGCERRIEVIEKTQKNRLNTYTFRATAFAMSKISKSAITQKILKTIFSSKFHQILLASPPFS